MSKKKQLKLISWNVNGLRAALKKDFDIVKDAFIDNEIFGSDHCPVGLMVAV
ncbi:MAG: exonuclease III [Thermodesulfobacteriota bacterium]